MIFQRISFFLLLVSSLLICSCEDSDGNFDLNQTFMNCSPELETIQGVEGVFLSMQSQDDYIFLANPISGQDELLRLKDGMYEQVMGRGSEVMDMTTDDENTLWICSSDNPDQAGLYSYKNGEGLTKHLDSPCSKVIAIGDFIYFITTEGTIASDQLRNIQCYHRIQEVNDYCTDRVLDLFESNIIDFTVMDDGTFMVLTHNSLFHTDGNQIIAEFNSNNTAGFNSTFSGNTLLEADGDKVLFSHVVGTDWMLFQYDGDSWSEIDLEDPDYSSTSNNRLIYSLGKFQGFWFMASNWGIYKISTDQGMEAHFHTGNSPLEDDHVNYFYWENDQSMWISYFFSTRLDHIYCP